MPARTKLINRRYRLERRISLTATNETWLGFDNVLHRAVAVSMPRPELLRDGAFLVQFLQRSRIATALHHRGIVAAFDSGQDGDSPYLVTEYLGGDSLEEIVRAESPFDVEDVAILISQLAGALDYSHQRGFAHGALTVEDVMVDAQGATKIIGLGLPIGTAVPRLRNPVSVVTDIAALGAIAFQMLTGEEAVAVEPESAGEAYLIDPDVPRNASDIVAIALGAGSASFTSAGAFARSLSGWRTFDPGAFFVAPAQMMGPEDEIDVPLSMRSPSSFEPMAAFQLEDEPVDSPRNEIGSSARRHDNQWAFLAVVILAIVAATMIWQGNQAASVSATQVPSQLSQLARLSGF